MLVERERELAEFDAVLDEVAAGKGCAIAIEASAGLGKTRLLQEARDAGGRRELGVFSARATELERDFPFALVRQLFEAPLAALPADERDLVLEGAVAAHGALGLEPDDDGHDSFAVLHSLYWVTAALAEREPLLLSVDDAHHADAASLDYLNFLLPRLEELPLLLVVACRPDEPDAAKGLKRILTDDLMRHLKPAPLSVQGTAALLWRELGDQPEQPFAAACHEVSGGTPFLLCELARTLTEQGIEPVAEQAELVRTLAPEQVARTVQMRIERLPAEAGTVARSLAVLGDGCDPRLIAELAGIDPAMTQRAADQLRASAILDPGAEPRFIHPLVRNAIYAEVPPGQRAQAHARAASLLRDRIASPEQIATQLLVGEAQGDRAAVETLVRAGERALVTGAPRSAIAYLTRALQEPPPAELRATILGLLITATFRAADQTAFAAIEPEIRAEMERDPSLRSRWVGQLTMSMSMGGRFEEVAAMLREAADAADAEGEVERAFHLEAQLRTVALLGPSVPAVDLARYEEQIDADSPAGRLAAAMEARSLVMSGTAREAADAAGRALANDASIFAEEPEIAAAVISVLTLVICDEIDPARQAVERALAMAREHGATTALVRAWFLSAFVAWGAGDLLTAEADLRQAMDLARLAGIMPLVLLFTPALIEILIERDELEAAEAEVRATGMSTGPVPKNVIFNALLLMRGHLRVEQGQFEQAAEDFALFSGQLERMGMGNGGITLGAPWAIRALVAIGEEARAQQIAEKRMVAARHWGAPATVAHVLRGVAVARGGAEGIEALEEAAALMEGSPRRLEHAHVLADLGAALRREGRRADARAPLRQAFELARRCGAARVAKRAHAELEATGATVRRYAPIGVESLTPSERRVAELAAAGMTNRQIAQSLFVTVKTVEAHLSAAYDKLDIDSRRQLGDALGAPDRSVE